MGGTGRFAAVAVVAAAAAAAAALLLRQPAPDAEAAHWRSRALEAEARIAALRERVRELEAARDAPAPRRAPEPAAGRPSAPPRSGPSAGADEPPDEAWQALVEGALQQQARERWGAELEPERLDRVVSRLRELREAAIALDAGGASQSALQQRLQRAVLVMEVDRALREELGIGMGELLSDLDAGAVDDLAASGTGVGAAPSPAPGSGALAEGEPP